VRKIRGQIEAVERALSNEKEECADTLQLLAACRGAINGLVAEVMEEHIREHLGGGKAPEEVTEDLLAIVRAYLKQRHSEPTVRSRATSRAGRARPFGQTGNDVS
jgi:DNA-binding FrmR family transcriptional regulator